MRNILVLSLSMSVLCGCMTTAHLYPVQGALSTTTPMPIYTLHVDGMFDNGKLSTNLNGQTLSGNWSIVPQDDPSANSMAADWDMVYGAGFFTAQVLGKPQFMRALLTGTGNASLNVEVIYSFGDTLRARGVGADNQGNVYKLAF